MSSLSNTVDALSQTYSAKLAENIKQEISQLGTITFCRFMELVLYAPGLGYYSAGRLKLGKEGDFVTAPELSALFSYCLAQQCQQILRKLNPEQRIILEFGAGSGLMAAHLLLKLKEYQALPKVYFIMEVSADLRERQKETIQKYCPEMLNSVVWLDRLPNEPIEGIILANEVLDAMPVNRFYFTEENDLEEYYVTWKDNSFVWDLHKANEILTEKIAELQKQDLVRAGPYTSEINFYLQPWLNSLSHILKAGVILLIDYGFPRHEYYHPDRSMGTLQCHFRHRVHSDPLILPGIQDISAHVDFSAVATAGRFAGLQLEGYTHQAAFLLNCGLEKFFINLSDHDQFKAAQEIKLLTLPHEMGELYKVIAFSKNFSEYLLGFATMDRSHTL